MQKKRFEYSFGKLLYDQFIEFKYQYLFAVLCLLVTHKIQSDLPFMAKELADLISKNIKDLNLNKFLLYAVGIIIFRTCSRIYFFYPARILQRFLRLELLTNLELSSPMRYRQINSGMLYQYMTADIDQIRALIGFVGLQGANFVIAICILLPRLFLFNKYLLVALAPMLVTFIIFTFIVTKNAKFFKHSQEAQAEVQNIIMESYVGKGTIKNFHAENSFKNIFGQLSLKELNYFYKASLGITLSLPLIALGIGLSLLIGALIIRSQELGASSLILFSGFVFLFMEPLSYLSWIGVVVARSSTSWKRLVDFNKILSEKSEIEIEIEKSNEQESLILPYFNQRLKLDIKFYKWNMLVSKTGDGKSELLFKLAEYFYLADKKVSLVSQDPYVFNDSIKNNIFLGRKISKDLLADAKQLLVIFGMDYLESNLDQLLELEVGENGKRLSGGQAKRLCLIRSILSDAEIFLWDDPFSSVDLIIEKEIILKLKELDFLKSKTFILTGHRISTVKSCDYVFYFEKEKGISEEGDTEKLFKNSSSRIYEFFEKQMV